jgi:hypothetical protein
VIGYNLVQAVVYDVKEIVVNTTQGETFRLVLQAENKKALEFRKKPRLDWLKPKVFKGYKPTSQA